VVQRTYPVRYEQSFNTVLAQEMQRFNKLTAVVRTSLQQLQKAVAGLLVMNATLEDTFKSLIINKLPAQWAKASYPSLKPAASYMEDLFARLSMLQTWYESGGYPTCHWISGYYFTHSFLTAALQNYARSAKIPIDEVGYDFVTLGMDEKEYDEAPESGVYVHGLFLEGCGWDSKDQELSESLPKKLFTPAPVIHLVPKLRTNFKDFPHYACPVYRTAERRGVLATTGHSSNFIMYLKMPTSKDPDHWTLRGTAMISQLSD